MERGWQHVLQSVAAFHCNQHKMRYGPGSASVNSWETGSQLKS